jgi:hypothetical protein
MSAVPRISNFMLICLIPSFLLVGCGFITFNSKKNRVGIHSDLEVQSNLSICENSTIKSQKELNPLLSGPE